jgi:hypothetical protein
VNFILGSERRTPEKTNAEKTNAPGQARGVLPGFKKKKAGKICQPFSSLLI